MQLFSDLRSIGRLSSRVSQFHPVIPRPQIWNLNAPSVKSSSEISTEAWASRCPSAETLFFWAAHASPKKNTSWIFLDLLGKNHNAGPLKDFSQGIHCALKLLHSSVHVASESIWTLLNAKNQLQCKQMRLQLFLPCKNQTHRATIAEYFKLPMTLRLKG